MSCSLLWSAGEGTSCTFAVQQSTCAARQILPWWRCASCKRLLLCGLDCLPVAQINIIPRGHHSEIVLRTYFYLALTLFATSMHVKWTTTTLLYLLWRRDCTLQRLQLSHKILRAIVLGWYCPCSRVGWAASTSVSKYLADALLVY